MTDTIKTGETLQAGGELRSQNGRYSFNVQGGQSGNGVIYRVRDMKPIWATETEGVPCPVTLSMQGDGNLVLYDANGTPRWASDTFGPDKIAKLTNDGELRVVDPVPSWKTVGGPDPEPDPPGPTPNPNDVPGANGLSRFFGSRAVGDDDGPKLYVGLSRMAWLWFWKFDRDRVLRELDADRAAGYRYGRVLAQVGDPANGADYWAGRIVDPDWPDYQDLIAGLTDAAAERGHLIEWTVSGKGGPYDNPAKRPDLIRRVAPVLNAHRLGCLFGEIMNEPNVQNEIGASEILDLAALAKSLCPSLPWATGAVWTEAGWIADDPSWSGGFSPAGWARTQGDVGICHLDRDMSRSELRDRPWRQGWDVGLESRRWADNEAVGPGSSVTSENRPDVLRSHRAVNFICRAFASTLHGKPGVRGDLRWEDPDFKAAYLQAPKAVRFLPGNLPNGSQENANRNYPNRPFTLDDPYVRAGNGNTRGIVRAYSCQVDGVFYTIPFGPVSAYELKVERNLRVTCLQQDTGDQVWERDYAAGSVIAFPDPAVDYLLISRPV